MAKKRAKMVGGREIGGCDYGADLSEIFQLDDFEELEKETSMARIGREAPDFELSAFHNGEFKSIKLSDYRGQWVLLCFYPGDFTFV